jgi:hypothetical protein
MAAKIEAAPTNSTQQHSEPLAEFPALGRDFTDFKRLLAANHGS